METDQFTTHDTSAAGTDPFRLETDHTLAVDVNGTVTAKAGSMAAYTGDLTFTGRTSAEGGITGFLKEAATGEGTPVMTVEGTGRVYLADNGKKVQIVTLDAADELTVNGDDVLAFESSVDYEIHTMDSLAGVFAGGLTNVSLRGPGAVAITTHGDPVVFDPPVTTDPGATVAWSRTTPSVDVNRSLTDVVGQESGERYQMRFDGPGGFVVVQPREEHGGG